MRVIALYRVSTEKQASEGASLDAQERAYRAMAAERGWTTVGEFKGCESASQASSDRIVLQRVLAAIRDEEPDAIWVIEQSRLTRGDELEVALLLRELRERGVKLLINGLPRDLASIDERFMVGIQSLVDRTESDRIKERMHRGKRERAKQGKKNSGPAAFGYLNPFKGMPGHGTLQVVEEEARAVRFIFEKRLEGHGEKASGKITGGPVHGNAARPDTTLREAVLRIVNDSRKPVRTADIKRIARSMGYSVGSVSTLIKFHAQKGNIRQARYGWWETTTRSEQA